MLFANRAWTKITGYEQHEVVGQDLKKLQGPLTNSKKISNMMEHIRDNGYGECEVINYTKDQSPYNTKIHVKPVIGRTSNNEHYISHYFAKISKTDMAADKIADPVIFGLENAKEYSWFVESMSEKGKTFLNSGSSSNDEGSQSGSAAGSASDEARREGQDGGDKNGGLRRDNINVTKKESSQNINSSSTSSESTGFHSDTGVTTNEEDHRSESDHYSSKDGHNSREVVSNHSSSEKSDADSSHLRARSSSSSSTASYPHDSYTTQMRPVLNFKSSSNSNDSQESLDNYPYTHKGLNNDGKIGGNKDHMSLPSLHNTVDGSSSPNGSSASSSEERQPSEESVNNIDNDNNNTKARKSSRRIKNTISDVPAVDKPATKRTRVPGKQF